MLDSIIFSGWIQAFSLKLFTTEKIWGTDLYFLKLSTHRQIKIKKCLGFNNFLIVKVKVVAVLAIFHPRQKRKNQENS